MINPAARGRRDANQREIVNTYLALGCSVTDTGSIGNGFPDLCIGLWGLDCLVEVKTKGGKMKSSQETFKREWRGRPVRIIRSMEDAINHVQEIIEETRS